MGPYRLTGRLGSGGMGQVFLGRSAGGRPVAVKVIRADLAADPEFRTRFRHEVESASRVNGLYTALVVDADTSGPVPWLATAYVSGPSLASAVATHGPLPAESVLALAAGLAEGLGAIHAAGVVHRDLKPANVLLADDGPRVIDFGISRAVEASVLTLTGAVVGSPAFMSPEQAEGSESGPPGDVFSLGGVLTFAATGRSPFGAGATPELLYRVVYGTPNLDGVPDHLRPLIADCLAKDPRSRPTTAGILARVGDIHPGVDWLPGPVLASIAAGKAADEAAGLTENRRTVTAAGTVAPASPPPQGWTQASAPPPEPPGSRSRPAARTRRFLAAGAAAAVVAAAAAAITLLLVQPGGTGSLPPGGSTSTATAHVTSASGSHLTTPAHPTTPAHTSSTGTHPPPRTLSWAAPRSIDGTDAITSVSCTSPSFCMAVDASGKAIAWNGSSWRSQGTIASNTGFNGVSCPSARFCAAVTANGSYFLWNGSSWRGPSATPNGETFEAIDCVSASFCAAVGGPEGQAGYAATWRAGVWAPAGSGYFDSMFSVSCPGDDFCLAAGDGVPVVYDETIAWNGSSWASAEIPVIGTSGVRAKVSCASQGFCMLVDQNGAAAAWNGTSWLHPSFLASGGLNWVSCATARLCAAVSSTGGAVVWNGNTWTSAGNIDDGQAMNSVSCPTSDFCVAVDAAGNALLYS